MTNASGVEWLEKAGSKSLQNVRHLVQTIRQGPRELAVAIFGVACFAAPKAAEIAGLTKLFGGSSPYVNGFYGLGTAAFGWVVFRTWRLALPTATPSLEPRPTAIKGPGAFGAQDGTLFRRLGREAELSRLYDYVVDDAVALVIVVGESGAGKTSLLRAGLSNVLEQAKIGYAYWEAVPSDPESGLLHAIRNAANIPNEDRPQDFAQLLQRDGAAQRLVIALDQFEQLQDDPHHRSIFAHLRDAVTQSRPPHRVTWIVAFRRDYEPDWRDFEERLNNFHPPRLPLRLLSTQQAQAVMATIAEESGFQPRYGASRRFDQGDLTKWPSIAGRYWDHDACTARDGP